MRKRYSIEGCPAPAVGGTLDWQPGSVEGMPSVVLRGPTNQPPDQIIGPFESTTEAREWAEAHPREDGFSVTQEVPIGRSIRLPGR